MTVLKYDDVIKEVMWHWLIAIFENSYTHAKFHSQGLTGSGFMTGGKFYPSPPVLFNVKIAHTGW